MNLLDTEENTKKRVDVIAAGIDKEIEFLKKKGKSIGMTETEINLQVKQLTKEKADTQKSFNEYILDLENKKNT
ncbi:MAG: hypothetical protein EOP55_18790, partial [Sphingobacteriales bacterium]